MAKNRKDINVLSDTELTDYIHALNILRARSAQDPDDETGYDFQAALHNDVFVGPCEHGSDLLFPWHRAHLHYFEQLLQASDPPRTADVTIPYWDWLHPEASGKFPAAFAKPGLFMPGRNNTHTELPAETLQIVTDEIDWHEFGGYPKGDPRGDYGRLELGPHNYMHPNFIGGKMANPATAAEDAIYWSFHAFIDLLWAEWQRRNSAPDGSLPPATSPDADLRGFLGQPKHKVRDFQQVTDLDQEYEYTDTLKGAFAVSPPVRARRGLLTTESLHPLFAADLESELRKTSLARFAFQAPPIATATAMIRLRNLKVPTTGSYLLRAYVHPEDVPFKPDDPEFSQEYGIGYVALWKAHGIEDEHGGHGRHAHHPPQPHHPTSCTVRFDVSRLLVGRTPGAASDFVLTLHYIPSPGPAGEPPSDPDLVKEVQLQDVLLEAYAQP